MKFTTLLFLLPSLCFSHTQVLISEAATKNLISSKGLVLQTNNETKRILFQICTVNSVQPETAEQFDISNCEVMGKKRGYSITDIEERIRDLENKHYANQIFQGGYIVLGTLLGALTGGVVGQQIALQTSPSQMYALISYMAGGIIVGAGSGLTLTILTKQSFGDLISPLILSDEKNVLKQSQNTFEEKVSLVVLKGTTLQKTVNAFQEVLLGIPE